MKYASKVLIGLAVFSTQSEAIHLHQLNQQPINKASLAQTESSHDVNLAQTAVKAPITVASVAQMSTQQLVAQAQPQPAQLVQKVPSLDSGALNLPGVGVAQVSADVAKNWPGAIPAAPKPQITA